MKKKFGQFYTTNNDYILSNLYIPENVKHIIEPFVGNGDLLFMSKKYSFELYDIHPNESILFNQKIIKQDTLKNPPIYRNKFVLTNPPYLAKNKSIDKELFQKYDTDDLYKCFIKCLLNDPPNNGIIILPVNFWCSQNTIDLELRKQFVKKFKIIQLNIFNEQVFNDTTYNVSSFQFEQFEQEEENISITLFPENINTQFALTENNNYTFGGEIYNLKISNDFVIERLTNDNCSSLFATNITVQCIDCIKKIHFYLDYKKQKIDKTKNKTQRGYLILLIEPKNNKFKLDEELIVKKCNEFIENYRIKYHSLFLPCYRDKGRKRISFNLVYKIVSHILSQI